MNKFREGNIIFGILGIIVGVVLILKGYGVSQKAWFNTIYLAFCIIFIAVCFFILIMGIITKIVKVKGKQSKGIISKLWISESTTNENGACSSTYSYHLDFKYKKRNNSIGTTESQISRRMYKRLNIEDIVPIIIYKDLAVLDKKKLKKLIY